MDEARAYFTGPDFVENPIGILFDPEQLIRDYEAGRSFEELVRRPARRRWTCEETPR